MAKAKPPKTTTNDAVSKIAAQPGAPSSPAAGTPESLAPATSTTKAESTKPKVTTSRTAKKSAVPSAVVPSSTAQSSVPRLEAVPNEGRTTAEARSNGDVMKSEGRGNVVPINLEDEIRKVAYLLAERRGFAAGHEREDWLAAEREVLQRYRQQQRA